MDYALTFSVQDVPWDHVVMLAGMQGVDGFLYDHMKHLGLLNILPDEVSDKLEESYTRTQKRAISILNEAKILSSRFQKAGIPVIALQGLSLMNVIYADPGLRPLGDIDLMVKPYAKKRLKKLLFHAGYWAPYPAYPNLLFKAGVLIDIHTHVLNLDRIKSRRYIFCEDLEPMWEKAVPMFDQPDGLLSLDPYDNIIALAAHALKHSYSRLIWIADIHECLLKWTDNTCGWKAFLERAVFWRQERMLLYALIFVEKIYKIKIPLWVKHELGIDKMGLLEKHLIRLRIRGFSSDALCIGSWLCNIREFRKKMEFIRETLFPKDEIMDQIFNKNSRKMKASIYAKRMGQALILIGRDLRQFLHFSFRSGGTF